MRRRGGDEAGGAQSAFPSPPLPAPPAVHQQPHGERGAQHREVQPLDVQQIRDSANQFVPRSILPLMFPLLFSALSRRDVQKS
jgi:hypothetical protein